MTQAMTQNIKTFFVNALFCISIFVFLISCAGTSVTQSAARKKTNNAASDSTAYKSAGNESEAIYLAVKGAVAVDNGDLDTAIRLFQRAAAYAPSHQKAKYDDILGKIYGARSIRSIQNGHLNGAISDLERGVPLITDWSKKKEYSVVLAVTYGVRGVKRIEGGDLDGAISDFEAGKNRTSDPEIKSSYKEILGMLYIIKGSINEVSGNDLQAIRHYINAMDNIMN